MASVLLEEVIKQPYQNCTFSAGFCSGDVECHDDVLYLKLDRPPEEPILVLLRPDEMAAIAYCASGALWSNELKRKEITNG